MSDTRCPGGDHSKPTSDICCDPCWERLPAKIEGRTWKRARAQARNRRAWHAVEAYNERIRRWLADNPLEKEPARV